MARRALIVGINTYDNYPDATLHGPINDAKRVQELLSTHGDDDRDPNYHCRVLTSDAVKVTKDLLLEEFAELFRDADDEVLFYFSGHGAVNEYGGYIVSQDAKGRSIGVSMDELLALTLKTKEKEVIFVLDCCDSGTIGDPAFMQGSGANPQSSLRQGISILAASRHNEPAMEEDGHGIFTSLFADALNGGAADILGNITLPAVYGFIEGSLGPWDQRPVYKTYTTSVGVLRRAAPRLRRAGLRRLVELFPTPDAWYQLTPEHEYDREPVTEIQQIDQLVKRFRDAGLIETILPGLDLYWVAMDGGSVRLTALGRHFWQLVKARQL